MGHALLCASGLVLLNTLLSCGQAQDKPKPDLRVSSSWPSPGASMTLNCSVKNYSAEWRYYWYQAFYKNSNNYYFELLPDGKNGTAQNSYIVHGQKQTAGYACRAGRQQPEHFTSYSKPVFVWSADSSSASATVKVTPDRVQHFSEESVSLRCEGKPSEWRVMRLSEAGYLANCSVWGTMNGSTCTIKNGTAKPAVYWCESKLGGFSNAVNLTVQKRDIILVSPVHPVTEGETVTLHCKLRNTTLKSSVSFFRNGSLISNDTIGKLNIPAVSKSDEGFYKCQYSGKQSSQRWMSVKAVSRPIKSSFTVQMIIGFVCGILLIAILLMVYLKAKGTQCKQTHVDSADPGVSQNACQLEALYSEVRDDNLLYALVMHKNKGESQNNAGRPYQAAAECAIYSEVRK
ncbi:low affinity immunoglobulin gamma Fc region receptor II-like isoform X1 [Oreochromis aureus]|nr:low affinity immunoglobulin gamma Fc region receptor II-like isoform X1 [Oreochromis aureus]